MPNDLDERLQRVRLLALDCDGVLTGNELIYDRSGDDQHVFNVRDGHGLTLLRHADIRTALISGRRSASVDKRVQALGFTHVLQQIDQKGAALRELCTQQGYGLDEVCYVGDDINDLGAVLLAGVGVAVADAAPELRHHARWVTTARGGHGAVREVCEALLEAKGQWQAILNRFMADGRSP